MQAMRKALVSGGSRPATGKLPMEPTVIPVKAGIHRLPSWRRFANRPYA